MSDTYNHLLVLTEKNIDDIMYGKDSNIQGFYTKLPTKSEKTDFTEIKENIAWYNIRFADSETIVKNNIMQQPFILVKTDSASDLQKIIELAQADGHKATIRSEVAHIEGPAEWAGVLNRKAFEAGILITQLSPQMPNLEETFFEMTGDRK